MHPRISVIMGIYNCAPTLPEALDSLFAQTFTEFKVILCDDGSTDNTFAIAEKYAEKYENIVLLKNEKNIKLAATLNCCLEYVDTEYVARMDGDDISMSTRFEKEINFLDQHMEYAFVSTAMIHFDETGDWGQGHPKEIPTNEDFRYGPPFSHAPCMVRSEVYRAVGGYTAGNNVERIEDYYLWYKIYKCGYCGYNILEPLYKMRDNRDALARRRFSDRIRAFKINIEVLKGLNTSLPYFYSLLNLLKVFVPNFIFEPRRRKLLKLVI